MKNGFLSYKGWQFLIMSAVAIQALKLQPRMYSMMFLFPTHGRIRNPSLMNSLRN